MYISFLESDYFWRLQALLTNHRLKCLLLQKKKSIRRKEVTMKSKIAFKPLSFADSLHFYTVCFTLHCAASISPQFSDLFIFLVSFTGHLLYPQTTETLKMKTSEDSKSVHTTVFTVNTLYVLGGKTQTTLKFPQYTIKSSRNSVKDLE